MLNPRTVNIYGFVAIAVMLVMLILVVAKLVPQRMYMTLFYAAAALFVVRIGLRIALARQQKKGEDEPGEGKGGAAGV